MLLNMTVTDNNLRTKMFIFIVPFISKLSIPTLENEILRFFYFEMRLRTQGRKHAKIYT